MDKPVDWNNEEEMDYLKVNIEVPDVYRRCRQCTEGECKECAYLREHEKEMSEVLANMMRPRMRFPF